MTDKEFYTGVGSRETPEAALDMITKIAHHQVNKGLVCRTGGAPGADRRFFVGCVGGGNVPIGANGLEVEVFLPWAKFNDWHTSKFRDRPALNTAVYIQNRPQPEAFKIAAKYHPAWNKLSNGVRCLHARNVHQVLGRDVNNPVTSKFLVCWTKNGKGAGGTGQAIRIAKGYGVPVYDLGDKNLFADRAIMKRLGLPDVY